MKMEKYDEEKVEAIASHYREIIRLLGEDPEREGLIKTPRRVAKALIDITSGYNTQPEDIVSQAIFEHAGSQIVIVKDIEFYSMCEHHILPFFGKIAIGYIPDGKMIGLSKLARIVDSFAKRLQVQERLTSQICQLLTRALPNKGVIVACEAGHLCMKMRGVEKQDAFTLTLDYSGKFVDDMSLRQEFLTLIKQ
ncbi:MAG: GTP cyclohydrolase I FolE [Muribaculaceae bacterium]|nr:GTP cyclohydrolase I FolE [Muribaculaceae bacterium]